MLPLLQPTAKEINENLYYYKLSISIAYKPNQETVNFCTIEIPLGVLYLVFIRNSQERHLAISLHLFRESEENLLKRKKIKRRGRTKILFQKNLEAVNNPLKNTIQIKQNKFLKNRSIQTNTYPFIVMYFGAFFKCLG